MNEDEDFKEDELITVRMTRGDYKVVMKMIDRERAYGWFTNMLKTNWIWGVGAGILVFIGLYDKIQALVVK